MCVINVSNQRLEVNAMYFRFGRVLVIILNLLLLTIICTILSEFYGVLIFRHGGYTEWSRFTPCTVTCGGGTKQRRRFCTNPTPSFGGYNCSRLGGSLEVVKCKERSCPINGGFERWSSFGPCSKTCEGGVQQRIRYCIEPIPKFGGLDCKSQNLGPYVEERSCNEVPCSVDGGYTTWTQWSKCSATCGGGVSTRERTCTNPEPKDGGKDCSGLGTNKEMDKCNNDGCPINGGYGEWTHWDQCSRLCGGGTHTRTRACDSPPPSNGGKNCFEMGYGNKEDVKPCHPEPCSKNGGYSNWTSWSPCTKTCGGGRTERMRHCNNPKPQGKGKTCKAAGLGASIEADECNVQPC